LERLLKALRASFSLASRRQIAIEVNPDAIGRDKARLLRELGVDWVTLGAQSLDDAVLKASRRSHRTRQAAAAYRAVREAGIAGDNVDLLFGLPRQTAEGFLRDVATVARWRPEQIHLNIYVNAPKTALAREGFRLTRRGFRDNLAVQEQGFAILENAGYARIDADSAGLTKDCVNRQGAGKSAKRASILGLGVVAVSYARGHFRYVNAQDLRRYIGLLGERRLPVERGLALTPRMEMIDSLLNSLEDGGGISARDFHRDFGAPLEKEFGPELSDLKARGVLAADLRGYRLTGHPGARLECCGSLYQADIAEKIAARYGLARLGV
jgi:oxygen-independent coproporphyrinogen-3 oxidase